MYKVAKNNPTSKSCDNMGVPLQLLATFVYCNTALCIWMVYLLDVCTKIVVHIHNSNIASIDDAIFHKAHCFHVCTLYVVTEGVLAPNVPVCVTRAVNFVVFALCWARTHLPHHVAEDEHWTSRVSLYASRLICVFVVVTEWFLYFFRGYGSWASDVLEAVFEQVWIFNFNLFLLFVSVRVYNTLCPDRQVHCLLSSL